MKNRRLGKLRAGLVGAAMDFLTTARQELFCIKIRSGAGVILSITSWYIGLKLLVQRFFSVPLCLKKGREGLSEQMLPPFLLITDKYFYMETTRQQKISRLIQKELSDIFQKQTKAMHGMLVSVSTVRISPDMSVCRAYLSVFPSERAADTLDNINRSAREIRYELGTRVRHQLRIIPELKFFLDDSLDYIDHIDSLLKQ